MQVWFPRYRSGRSGRSVSSILGGLRCGFSIFTPNCPIEIRKTGERQGVSTFVDIALTASPPLKNPSHPSSRDSRFANLSNTLPVDGMTLIHAYTHPHTQSLVSEQWYPKAAGTLSQVPRMRGKRQDGKGGGRRRRQDRRAPNPPQDFQDETRSVDN